MTLIKTGGGITDIRGGFGGVYFTRDRSGLHSSTKPRRVHQQTAGQKVQRDAFSAARRYSKDNRIVSYLMYRYMNGLPIDYPDAWTSPVGHLDPDSDWWDETNAYDGDTGTRASSLGVDEPTKFIVFTLATGVLCDKIKIWLATPGGGSVSENIDIDLYYNGGWHNFYLGELLDGEWNTINFTVKEVVSKARARFYAGVGAYRRLYEFAFYTLNNPLNNEPHVPVPADYQIPGM